MTELDREYYAMRSRMERDRGDRAGDRAVARVHHKLADMYEQRIASAQATRPTLQVVCG